MVLLLDSFVQLVLLHQLWAGLDVGRCCFIRQVEEIDVGLHKTFGKEFNSNRLFGHFLVQLEVALLLKVLSAARQVGSRGSLLRCIFLRILVQYSRFSGCDQLILLLGLRFLCDLTDARVRVEYGLQFHSFRFHTA